MNERCTSFLLIDIRSNQDYESCRIDHSTSINVPEEILHPGRFISLKKLLIGFFIMTPRSTSTCDPRYIINF